MANLQCPECHSDLSEGKLCAEHQLRADVAAMAAYAIDHLNAIAGYMADDDSLAFAMAEVMMAEVRLDQIKRALFDARRDAY